MTFFDLLKAPLDGSNLIEASAGTGKTHNIVGLYLRLVVEQELAARDILVVTYTIAATAELRDRIRTRLVQMQEALAHGTSGDDLIAGLLGKLEAAGRTEKARRLLRAALRDFDNACILTIHSFCYRMLREYAFESGALFDTELIPDEDAVLLEFIQDFWRRHFYEAPLAFMRYCLHLKLTPDDYLNSLKQAGPGRKFTLIPESHPPDMAEIKREIDRFASQYTELKNLWKHERSAIEALLRQPGLNGRVYGKKVDKLLESLDAFFAADAPTLPLDGDFEKITSGRITQSMNKGHTAPCHRFFDLAQAMRDQANALCLAFDQHLLHLRVKLFREAREELPRRKRERNILAYDDLLITLDQALHSERGVRLAQEIGSRFRAVLIDEFQDTDPIQYDIFRALFLDGGGASRPFFVIGDPKQAIYAFRGADIFAYIQASRSMQHIYTLKDNWRSGPGLLQAVNTLFSAAANPFFYEEIRFHPTTAAPVKERKLLRIDHEQPPPFVWWLIPEEKTNAAGQEDDAETPPTKGLARTGLHGRVAASVASECARLVRLGREGRAVIGDRPLQAEDIAILVRTNREVDIMQEALVKWNLPCVTSSRESVFHTPEAEDIRRILVAMADPRKPSLLRAALLTDIVGLNGDDLLQIDADERRAEEILRRFILYHDIWATRGFVRMFRTFLELEHIPSRILRFIGGERRLTNLMHLGEMLHQAATAEHLGISDLIRWLAERMQSRDAQPEEYELRLERDDKAIRVVTIHKSKGLEYPIVFCPFFWGSQGPRKKRSQVLFHDPAEAFSPILDVGSDDFEAHSSLLDEEALAEEIRLLYVALTRARHRTYFIGGRFRNGEKSAAAYLFHRGMCAPGGDQAANARERYATLTVEDFTKDVAAIADSAGGTILIEALPEAAEKPYRPDPETGTLSCREFRGTIDTSWKTASFTFLVSPRADARADHDMEEPRLDTELEPDEPAHERYGAAKPAGGIFDFPGGARTGLLLHEILEEIDYRDGHREDHLETIAVKLSRYGYSEHWAPVLAGMVEKVVTLPLPALPDRTPVFTLSQILPEERCNEVEFYFPLRRIAREDLARLFQKGAAMADSALSRTDRLHCLERLGFSPLEGYLKGFIDLVFRHGGRFYLADWKSNHLGVQPHNYATEALRRVMDEGYYYIQYHLYALALHRYLAFRVPDYRYNDHFGGVFYFFLRGMDPAAGNLNGVFSDRPPLSLLEQMTETLLRKPLT